MSGEWVFTTCVLAVIALVILWSIISGLRERARRARLPAWRRELEDLWDQRQREL
ncbi:hypothetical protein [Actinokineospora cianjurensis]|uniref:Uncharacterized protein n=1 Tax=Actinokineospora cianjurensis TaxID=585224 RepID=A0A421B4N4_9PSEU|nr:hypothetical protein [Actinokineospora cianjurensis]RLK59243.1 hypothetical protein CLV68_3727 [Actinokineospora cianjurensis]